MSQYDSNTPSYAVVSNNSINNAAAATGTVALASNNAASDQVHQVAYKRAISLPQSVNNQYTQSSPSPSPSPHPHPHRQHQHHHHHARHSSAVAARPAPIQNSNVHHSHHSSRNASPAPVPPQQQSSSSSSTSQLRWKTLDCDHQSTDAPSPRTYFSMVSYNKCLYLLGGFGDSKGRFNDLRVYDTERNEWRMMPTQQNDEYPRPLYLHTSCVHQDSMYVFGGSSSKDSNEMYAYHLVFQNWIKLPLQPNTPSARYGHAACILNDDMYIVGGCQQSNKYYNDAYRYNITTATWYRLPDVPMDLAYHSLTSYNNKIYLIGGYNGMRFSPYTYVLDTTANSGSARNTWIPLKSSGHEPPPLCGAAVMINPTQDELYLFGGYTAHGHTNELYRLSFITNHWEMLQPSNKPLARAYLQASLIDDTIYLFGGYNGTNCIADFRSIYISRPVNLLQCILENDLNTQVKYVLKHFAKTHSSSNGQENGYASTGERGAVLERPQIELLLKNIATHIHTIEIQRYPFDASRIQDLMDLGFTRNDVIQCLEACHRQGINTSNYEIVVDKLLSLSLSPTASASGSTPTGYATDTPSTMKRAATTTTATTSSHHHSNQHHILSEDHKMCKICFDHEIDCALLNCGHMCVCTKCAQHLVQHRKPCPLCRNDLASFLKVYYS